MNYNIIRQGKAWFSTGLSGLLMVAMAYGLIACAGKNKTLPVDGSGFTQPATKKQAEKAVPPPKLPPKKETKSKPDIVPQKATLTGRVALVNDRLKYVIVEFPVGRVPEKDQVLSVFRAGQKVGEVRVSAQSRDFNYAADIIDGEARSGDEIREL